MKQTSILRNIFIAFILLWTIPFAFGHSDEWIPYPFKIILSWQEVSFNDLGSVIFIVLFLWSVFYILTSVVDRIRRWILSYANPDPRIRLVVNTLFIGIAGLLIVIMNLSS